MRLTQGGEEVMGMQRGHSQAMGGVPYEGGKKKISGSRDRFKQDSVRRRAHWSWFGNESEVL